VPYGCTLMLVGEGDALQELELGASSDAGIPQKLLFLQAGSTVILQRLSLTGVASPAVGKVGLPSGIDVRVLAGWCMVACPRGLPAQAAAGRSPVLHARDTHPVHRLSLASWQSAANQAPRCVLAAFPQLFLKRSTCGAAAWQSTRPLPAVGQRSTFPRPVWLPPVPC
jgi:hypothetical protein